MLLKSKHFKSFYITVLLAAPAFWMVFSDDGQRFVDVTILKIKGGDVMDIHLNALHSNITEDLIKTELPDVEFSCGNQVTPFGNSLCQASLASFNGIPARYGIYYFDNGHLQAFKMGYQRIYHSKLINYIRSQLGTPNAEVDATIPTNIGVYHWNAGNGKLVVLKEQAIKDKEPAIMWTVGQ